MGPVLAVDLGGTELRAALVDGSGRILATQATATDAAGGPDAVIGQMVELVERVRGDEPVTRLGLAAPGPLDPDAGVVLAAPMLAGWRDVPLVAALRDRLGLDVVLENDANAAALGEWRFGAGRGTRSMVFVTVSTGIGGGVVVDGHLLHGRRGMAAEVGHMSVTQGVACVCGGVGCWEAVASGTALARAAAATLAADGGPATGRQVEAAARRGESAALALLDAEADWLGIGIANLLHLYSPERVVLGGGVMACFDLLRERMAAMVRARAMPAYRDVPVVLAELGGRAGLIGAASLVLPDAGPA
jgi:glucokinase